MASANKTRLDAYLAAETQLLTGGQSVEIAGRSMTRADLREIRAAIVQLQRAVAREGIRAGGSLAGFKQASF